MTFRLEQINETGKEILKIKKPRKSEFLIYKDSVCLASLKAVARDIDFEDVQEVVVVMIEGKAISKSLGSRIKSTWPGISWHHYDSWLEITIPVGTIWDEEFLQIGRKEKWFKTVRKARSEILDSSAKDMEEEPSSKKSVKKGRMVQIGLQRANESFKQSRLRKLIGVPTEEEWLEKQSRSRFRR